MFVPRSSISSSEGVVLATRRVGLAEWNKRLLLFGGVMRSVFFLWEGGVAYGWLGGRRIRVKVPGRGWGLGFMGLGERSCLCVYFWIWDAGDSGEWLGYGVVWFVFVLIY